MFEVTKPSSNPPPPPPADGAVVPADQRQHAKEATPGSDESNAHTQQKTKAEHVYHGVPLYDGWESAETTRFVVNGYQDTWAAVVFAATIVVTFVWGTANYASDLDFVVDAVNNNTQGGSSFSGTTASTTTTTISSSDAKGAVAVIVLVLLLLVAVSTLLAFGALAFLRSFAHKSIVFANVGTAVVNFIVALVAFADGMVGAGVFFVIFGAIQLLWLYLVRSRIPFSAILLERGSNLAMKYTNIVVVNFLLIGFFAAYFLFWTAMIFPTLREGIVDENPPTSNGVMLSFFMLLLFWTSQVVFNVMHVTAAGVAATWYFVGDGVMPPSPTFASFKRAVTTSFGSICFGSLLVAIVKLIRWLAESNRRNRNPFIMCIAICLLRVLERLLEYFNTYAFVHVAIYGCGYIEAAKRTWKLAQECLFAAYFNDALVGQTLFFIAIGVSGFVGVITALATRNGALGSVVFCLCFCVHILVLRVLESFVVTLFVCFAQEPESLKISSPELYALLQQADSGEALQTQSEGNMHQV